MNDIPTLVTTPSDRKMADDLRRRLEEALRPVCALMDEATCVGLNVRWALGPDEFNRSRIQHITIVRPL